MAQDVCDISAEDLAETYRLLKDIPDIASNVSSVIQSITKKSENGELQMQKGLSFLDLKNLNLLSYISNLTYVIVKKLNGNKIEDDPAVKRLAELRIVMEKMRPIDDRLKYQVHKLLATAVSQNVDSKDPLHFRANPESLDVEDEDEQLDEDKKESKVYVPPKISATYYDEDNILESKRKALEQAQRRALSSSMLYELRKEYDTGPEEIKEMHDPYKIKLSEELKERERYEEEYMLRLPMTKKKRHEMKQLTTVTNFNTKFEDISALEMDPHSMQMKKKSRGKKGKFNGKGKKKGFKRKY